MDIFGRFARDPACLVAIDAADGGTWRSPFRPGVVYPSAPSGSGSFEERTGLLVKTNVKTSNGYFEPALSSSRWSVVTPLRWSSLSAATFVVRATMDTANTTIWSIGQPANPGNAIASVRKLVTQIVVRFAGVNASGTAVWSNIYIPFSSVINRLYVIVLRYDIASNFLDCYVDGQLVGSATVGTIVAPAADNPLLPGLTLGTGNGSDAINALIKTANMMVFGRALSIGEIQLLR